MSSDQVFFAVVLGLAVLLVMLAATAFIGYKTIQHHEWAKGFLLQMRAEEQERESELLNGGLLELARRIVNEAEELVVREDLSLRLRQSVALARVVIIAKLIGDIDTAIAATSEYGSQIVEKIAQGGSRTVWLPEKQASDKLLASLIQQRQEFVGLHTAAMAALEAQRASMTD